MDGTTGTARSSGRSFRRSPRRRRSRLSVCEVSTRNSRCGASASSGGCGALNRGWPVARDGDGSLPDPWRRLRSRAREGSLQRLVERTGLEGDGIASAWAALATSDRLLGIEPMRLAPSIVERCSEEPSRRVSSQPPAALGLRALLREPPPWDETTSRRPVTHASPSWGPPVTRDRWRPSSSTDSERSAQTSAARTCSLKPNLVEFDPTTAINTEPRLIAATVLALRRLGAASVRVAEGPGHRGTSGTWSCGRTRRRARRGRCAVRRPEPRERSGESRSDRATRIWARCGCPRLSSTPTWSSRCRR